MNEDQNQAELLAASRLTGADIRFLQLVQLVSSKLTGRDAVTDPSARASIERLQAEFRSAYASIFEKHLGRAQALASLCALESAPVQRYLAARQIMAPELTQRLTALQQAMGNIEV